MFQLSSSFRKDANVSRTIELVNKFGRIKRADKKNQIVMHVKRAYVVMKAIGKSAMLILNLSENEKMSIWDKNSHLQFFMLETLKSFLKRDE